MALKKEVEGILNKQIELEPSTRPKPRIERKRCRFRFPGAVKECPEFLSKQHVR